MKVNCKSYPSNYLNNIPTLLFKHLIFSKAPTKSQKSFEFTQNIRKQNKDEKLRSKRMMMMVSQSTNTATRPNEQTITQNQDHKNTTRKNIRCELGHSNVLDIPHQMIQTEVEQSKFEPLKRFLTENLEDQLSTENLVSFD